MKFTKKSSRWEELVEAAGTLNMLTDASSLVEAITEKAVALLHAEHAFLYLMNPRTRETIRTINRRSPLSKSPQLREVETFTSGWIMRYHQSLISDNLQQDDRFSGLKHKGGEFHSAIGIPLLSDLVLIGSLVLINKNDGGGFQEEDLFWLEKFGQIITPFMRNTQQFCIFFEKTQPAELLIEKYFRLGLLGKSKAFIELLQAIDSAAQCDVRVLLQGASGTGKELVARAIHQVSSRWSGPFIAIDCGAIPANLVESELMGHVRGAFTGANNDRKGLFEAADHGTLFMDEIVNLPLEMQSKLLRVLQEGEIRPVGSNRSRKIDIRIITAASSSLEKRVQDGLFREDLYYRLHVFPIMVSSLQERREDIGLLADHFLQRFAHKQNKQARSLHPEIVDLLKRHNWPGNIRELENFMERLVTLTPKDITEITRLFLPPDLRKELSTKENTPEDWAVELSLAEKVAAYEAQLIRQALQEHAWNQSRTARALKMPAQTLHYKMEKLKIIKV